MQIWHWHTRTLFLLSILFVGASLTACGADSLSATQSTSSSSSSSSSTSSSSSSGVALVMGTPEIYRNCSPDTPDAWPCSLDLSGNDSFYCDGEGNCTFLEEANGFTGWNGDNCDWDHKPETACTYMTPTRIYGCELDECGHYNRVPGLVEEYQTRCTYWGDWYVPCTVINEGGIGGCTSGECGGSHFR